MKKKIIILVSLFIILIIVNAPVMMVEKYIPTNNGLSVNGLQGTIWSGEVARIESNGLNFSQVNYSLSVVSLLTGKLGGVVEIQKGDVTGTAEFEIENKKNISIEQANLKASAMSFEKYLPIKGIELNGSLYSRDLNLLVMNERPTLIEGVTEWKNASINFKGKSYKIGNLKISWETNSETKLITGTILKTKNILSLEGLITLNKQGLFEFKGSISNKIDKMIYNALIFFSDGKVVKGRLPIKFKKKII